MNIRMLVGLAGNEYALSPGDEREFPDKEAIRLIDAGYAVPVANQKVERAVATPAVERRGKRGKADVVSRDGDNAAD
ncbi:hypothetical protein [Sinorhizobium meliloti]|uniref:hypothetical protein n=1 Tax=Rhizobium meliloti TaxID=382 RepID=UPI000FDCB106|nr:hypothetical protein [Sinorhizobium meliloti]RVG43590.1 hypothetical protein CN226_32820 [Sinorhizobium meliloti]WQP12213.1 hypothetical protein U8C30_24590 [Sinorhizobium meliloti]WQP25689.1 hypothetical protein U8C43_24545 [Sinorhizobium meliloti]